MTVWAIPVPCVLAPDSTKTVSKSKLTVQITLALLGDAAATLLLIVLEDTDLLEGLEDLAVNGARGLDVVGGTAATVLGSAVDAAETANTNGLAEVDVAGNGGGADVEPVDVLGGHLLGGAGLDGVNPTCYRELAGCLFIWGNLLGFKAYRERAACPGASRKQHRR